MVILLGKFKLLHEKFLVWSEDPLPFLEMPEFSPHVLQPFFPFSLIERETIWLEKSVFAHP